MDSKGFSLLDLLITLSVIGIGAAVGVNTMSQATESSAIRQEAQKVKQTLMGARRLAQTTLDCVEVTALPQMMRVVQYSICSPSPSHPTVSKYITIRPALKLNVPTPGKKVVFQANGGISDTAPFQIDAEATTGMAFQYTVLPAIGTVRMK